jgi:hypothetical protein
VMSSGGSFRFRKQRKSRSAVTVFAGALLLFCVAVLRFPTVVVAFAPMSGSHSSKISSTLPVVSMKGNVHRWGRPSSSSHHPHRISRHHATGNNNENDDDDDSNSNTSNKMMGVFKKSPGAAILAPFVLLFGLDLVANVAVVTKRSLEVFFTGEYTVWTPWQ